MDEKFKQIYYSDDVYWRGKTALQKLSRASGSTKEEAEKNSKGVAQALQWIYENTPLTYPKTLIISGVVGVKLLARHPK